MGDRMRFRRQIRHQQDVPNLLITFYAPRVDGFNACSFLQMPRFSNGAFRAGRLAILAAI